MKLTVLVDNNTYIDQYFLGEPAVSYYIESGEIRLLFDTGYSDIFISNAEALGINLTKLTHIVLSHGHNDHTNGLKYLSQKIDLSKVVLVSHTQCFYPKADGRDKIGAPYSVSEIKKLCCYHSTSLPYTISEDFTFLGEIPALNDFEERKGIGLINTKGKWITDYNYDDSALVYRSSDGLFIITGCSHSGICNIVEYAKKICKEDRISGIIGGFHLFEANNQLEKTVNYLNSCNIQHLYPCHCVSLEAKCKMSEKLPLTEVGVGLQISM